MRKLIAMVTLLLPLTGQPQVVLGQDEVEPTMELLEFLGDWSTNDNDWLDMSDLEQMNLPEQEHNKDETEK